MTTTPSWTTPDLCDAHADLRVLEPGFLDFGGRPRFHGVAVTVGCPDDNSKVREILAEPGHGRVLVVAGGGLRRYALLGDQLALLAHDQGWAGVIVDGAVRDVEVLRGIDLGLRAKGSYPLRTHKRGLGAVDLVVRVGGATVRPGDHVYADATGIVVASRALT